jgi:hypothetical protein
MLIRIPLLGKKVIFLISPTREKILSIENFSTQKSPPLKQNIYMLPYNQ